MDSNFLHTAAPSPAMTMQERLVYVAFRSSVVWLEMFLAVGAIVAGVSMLNPNYDVRQAAEVIGHGFVVVLTLANFGVGLAMILIFVFGSRCWKSYSFVLLFGAAMSGGNAAMMIDNQLVGLTEWTSSLKACVEVLFFAHVAVRGMIRCANGCPDE